MNRIVPLAVGATAAALALAGLASVPGQAAEVAQAPSAPAAGGAAELYVVQGVPDTDLDIAIDGEPVDEDVATTTVVGPFDVEPGTRTVTFSDDDEVVLERSMDVAADSSSDVVVHLMSTSPQEPEVTVFENDLSSVPRGKARLTVAHTAAVAPADIRVDDQVQFANVANGESLTLTVPAKNYAVDLVPTGQTSPTLFGPVDLSVQKNSLNRVFAVGDPSNNSMNVAVHVIDTPTSGSRTPSLVDTGTGGQADRLGLTWTGVTG